MTILRRNIQEVMNNRDRGFNTTKSINMTEIADMTNAIQNKISSIYNIRPVITATDVKNVYEHHINLISKIIEGVSAKDLVLQRTYNEIVSRELGRISQETYQSSLSYPESIDTMKMSNTNLIKGTIRSKRNVSGVSAGVRLF